VARILLVNACWLPERIDGTIVVVERLARAFSAAGHECTVLCRRLGSAAPTPVLDAPEARLSHEEVDGLRIIRAELPRERRFGGGLDHPDVPGLFARVLDEERPAVVHLHHHEHLSSRLERIAEERGIPTVLTLHDFHPVCATVQLVGTGGRLCSGPDGGRRCARCWPASARAVTAASTTLGRARRLIDVALGRHRRAFAERCRGGAEALAAATAVVSPSHHLAATVARLGGLPEGRIAVVPHGVDERPTTRPCAAGAPPVIGFLGNVQRAKGVHRLCEALSQLVDLPWSLRVHGSGQDAYLERLRAQLPEGRAQFPGAYRPAEAEAILSGIDLVAVPSVWPEAFSLVTAQALAGGVPCVASGWGGPAELVRDGVDGVLVAPDDATALAAALRPLLEDPQRILALAANAAARPRRTWSDCAADYLALFARLGALR
jgi:glycosyltransferase involved in cell wall biosynthesis